MVENTRFSKLSLFIGQPKGWTDDDCAMMEKTTSSWFDMPCKSQYGYICKKTGKYNFSLVSNVL